MDNNKCGENVVWLLSGNTLVIIGKGAMKDYSIEQKAPWYDYWKSILKVVIGDGVTTIGNCAFFGCENLMNVKIPDTVTTIGLWAFDGCKNLENLIIPESVTTIGAYAFTRCDSLRSVTIPFSVKTIGIGVFSACYCLWEILYPANHSFKRVLSQGNYAQLNENFRWKVEGKTLTVGGVSEIKAYSYEETPWRDSLNNIQQIIIEDSVEKISARAFEECRRLELLTIPASVKTIGDMAFSFCYCGNGLANGGRNVYWTLEGGVLNLKKNPTVRGNADFSTGAVTWLAVDKNITGIKLDAGVVAKEKFFEWLSKRSNAMQIAFG